MEELKISKQNAIAAYVAGSEETKETLKKLFPDVDFSIKVTDRIKTWQDVMDALNMKESDINDMSKAINAFQVFNKRDKRCVKAFVKVLCIVKALNEGWELTKETYDKHECYFVYWIRKDGISGKHELQASSNCAPGFVYAIYGFGSSAWALVPRLAFKTLELAEYAVTQFPDIWREYYNNYEQDL